MAIDNGAPKAGGIDFARTFGQPQQDTTSNTAKQDRPVAKFWLNIGYNVPGAGDDGEDRFVALPVGIPLDTMKPVTTNSRNDSYREFMAAKNDLLEQIMEAAQKLQPGEERKLNLEIQLRHVADVQAPVERETNRFARPLDL